jgi:hypothetical protein
MDIIRDFIKSAVIIDDKEEELEPLAKALEAEDIFVDKIPYDGVDTKFSIKKKSEYFLL